MRLSNPPPCRRGDLRVATRERGRAANWANWANPPPSDFALARQVTLQVTYGVWGEGGAKQANRGWLGGTRRSVR